VPNSGTVGSMAPAANSQAPAGLDTTSRVATPAPGDPTSAKSSGTITPTADARSAMPDPVVAPAAYHVAPPAPPAPMSASVEGLPTVPPVPPASGPVVGGGADPFPLPPTAAKSEQSQRAPGQP
jgi:hypothetical protein